FGSLIKYIPYTITTGFTCGIGVSLLVGQIKDFLGLKLDSVPSEFIDKVAAYARNINTTHITTLLIGLLAIAILVILPKITDKIPASLVAIIVTTLVVKLAKLPVSTIGSVYGELSSKLPMPHVPNVTFDMIKNLISPAFTIALLAGIESLLSAVVSDGMIGDKHNSNAELIGQGLGNIFSGLFGGIPATGAIARTATNVKNGGRTPIAGMVHSITLLAILLLLMPYAALIPMTTLAAVLIIVAWNMCNWSTFFRLIKTSPKSDIIVLLGTFLLTVIFDLVVAIEVGIVVSALLFMKRMSDTSEVKAWKYIEEPDVTDGEAEKLMSIPKEIRVFEINGPMFFAASECLTDINSKKYTKVIVIRMRAVPAIDASAMHALHDMADRFEKKGIKLVFSHVNEQPLKVMKKEGLYDKLGADNFQPDIVAALDYAETLLNK
ncbi:MAG: SulP family inorganic anion transporter, partial [Coprococcus sp.]